MAFSSVALVHRRERLLSPLRIGLLKAQGVRVGSGTRVLGPARFYTQVPGQIRLGERCSIVSEPSMTALGVPQASILRALSEQASIEIGNDTGISGAVIVSAGRVTVGDRVLLGSGVRIVDTDFHPVDQIPRRHLPVPESSEDDWIRIGDDAFLGAGVIVLKGVSIGRGTVVGAGSVVSSSLPAGVVAAGVPAKVLRTLLGAHL